MFQDVLSFNTHTSTLGLFSFSFSLRGWSEAPPLFLGENVFYCNEVLLVFPHVYPPDITENAF